MRKKFHFYIDECHYECQWADNRRSNIHCENPIQFFWRIHHRCAALIQSKYISNILLFRFTAGTFHQRILTNRLNRCKYIIEFASVIQMWFKTWRNCNECFCYRRSSISKLQLYATDLVETLKLLENNKNWSFCCILKMPRQWICKYPYETLRSRPRPRWIFHSWCNCRTYHEHRHPFSSPFSPQIVFSYFSQL